jgi:hypothetical protein
VSLVVAEVVVSVAVFFVLLPLQAENKMEPAISIEAKLNFFINIIFKIY